MNQMCFYRDLLGHHSRTKTLDFENLNLQENKAIQQWPV